VSNLGRLWDWLLPGLIYLDPMVATAYYQAVAQDETLQSNARGRAPVSYAWRVLPLPAVRGAPASPPEVQIPQPAPARR
jgi:hypothetical protein